MSEPSTVLGRAVRRSALVVVALLIAALASTSLTAAEAAGTGTIGGVVSGDVAQGWDNRVRIELYPVAGGTIAGARTDPATGAWSATLPAGTSWTIRYEYDGAGNFLSRWEGGATGQTFEAHQQFTIVAGETITVNRTLPVGGSISGTIAGTNGLLDVATVTPRINPPFYPGGPRVTVNLATGEWRVDRLQTSSVRLTFSSTSRWRTELWQDAATEGSSTSINAVAGVNLTGYNVVLSPLAALAGVVTASMDGQPIARVEAQLRASNGTIRYAMTGFNGAYEFTNIPPGTYTLCFSNVGDVTPPDPPRFQYFAECYGEDQQPGGAPITIAAEQWVDGVNIALSRNGNLSGTVTTNNSLSSGPSEVNLYRETVSGSRLYALEQQTTSRLSGGGYVFYGLEPGNYVVSARRSSSLFGSAVVYYPDARLFRDAEVISISVDNDVQLTTINLNTELLPDRDRHSGADRFATGAAITMQMFPPEGASTWTVPVVYIANGLNYPDALSAGPAAAHLGGPLLLVRPSHIPDPVRAELERLNPERIVVVGGLGAVSAAVESQLRDFVSDPSQVSRVGGSTRYETGLAVARDAFRIDDAVPEQVEAVFLASGANYPDALAAGPAAAYLGGPVVLLDPRQPGLPDDVRGFIETLDPDYIYVVGGTGSLPASLEADIAELGNLGELRLSGANRYETSLRINQAVFLYETEEAVLATGQSFADALAGGPFAAQLGAPLYLASSTCIPLPVLEDMSALNVQRIHLLGGTGSLNAQVESLRAC